MFSEIAFVAEKALMERSEYVLNIRIAISNQPSLGNTAVLYGGTGMTPDTPPLFHTPRFDISSSPSQAPGPGEGANMMGFP